MKRILRASALLMLLMLTLAAGASTPKSLVKMTVLTDPGVMPGDDIAVLVDVENGHDETIDLIFDNAKTPDIEGEPTLFVWPPALKLPAKTHATIEVVGRAHAAGKFAIVVRGAVKDELGVDLLESDLPLFLRVNEEGRAENLTVQLEDFDTLFSDEAEYLRGVGRVFPAKEGVGGLIDPATEEPILIPDEPAEESQARVLVPKGDATTTHVKGQFRWVDTKNKLQPALGWRAAMYVWKNGQWVDTGHRATVDNNANYDIATSLPANTYGMVVFYLSNRYFDLMDGKANKYYVALPYFTTGLATMNYGAYYIDLNQSVPGLGELHRNAFNLYSKFTQVGFSPLRKNPIRIIFPGTDDCGSCTLNGTVHIEFAKGTSSHTIKHELGHELMYQYWGGMPSGSGGYHEWPKCYNEGLALSEGFAHFVAWWSDVNRGTLSGSWGMGYNGGESLSNDVCKSVGKNELRIAATFWDLHDTKVDGVDLYTNASEARILEMILEGGGVLNTYTQLMYPRLETAGGLEWWRIEPISEMNFAN